MENKTTGSFTEVLLFLALVFGATWILWVPLAALGITVGNFVGTRHGSPLALIPFLLGGFVPSGVALMLTAKRQGPEGLGKLLRRVTDFRIGWRWHTAAFVLVALPAACQIAILKLLGNGFDWTLFLRQLPSALPLILIGPLSEELGWRGYLLDRLQERFSPYAAAALMVLLLTGLKKGRYARESARQH